MTWHNNSVALGLRGSNSPFACTCWTPDHFFVSHDARINALMNTVFLTPEQVVQEQLDAFNARDLDSLLTIYAEDAEMFEHPSKLLASGAAQLRERFSARFSEPDLHALLRRRMVMGNIVVDHEEVTRNFPEGKGTLELIMIYEVQRGKIAKAWSIAGAKILGLS